MSQGLAEAWALLMNGLTFGASFKTMREIMKTKTMLAVAAALTISIGTIVAEEGETKPKAKVDLSKLPPASDKKDVTYASDIKPIFDESCIKCHGEEKQKGKLRLDGLEAVMKGGEDGKVITPGKSAESMLVINVAQASDDEEEWMPPPKNKANIQPLTKEQVGLIRAWIDQGAK
jgi:hypothetical protein